MTRAEKEEFIREECAMDEEWADTPEPVGECEYCGKELFDWDDATAIVTADGKACHCYCTNCFSVGRGVLRDVLDNAGVSYYTGWADEAIRAARFEVEQHKKAEKPARRRVLVVERGIRPTEASHGQRAF